MRQPKARKPDISGIEAAGSLLGLDESDLKEVYNVSRASKLKEHLTRSILIFLFSLLAVIVIAFILGKFLQNTGPPIRPYYAVTSKDSVRAARFLFRGVLAS
jgi:hypothetical protein